jgi:hypothetical protein
VRSRHIHLLRRHLMTKISVFYHLLQMQLYQVHSHFHTLKHAVTSVLLQSETTSLPLANLSHVMNHYPWAYP